MYMYVKNPFTSKKIMFLKRNPFFLKNKLTINIKNVYVFLHPKQLEIKLTNNYYPIYSFLNFNFNQIVLF